MYIGRQLVLVVFTAVLEASNIISGLRKNQMLSFDDFVYQSDYCWQELLFVL